MINQHQHPFFTNPYQKEQPPNNNLTLPPQEMDSASISVYGGLTPPASSSQSSDWLDNILYGDHVSSQSNITS